MAAKTYKAIAKGYVDGRVIKEGEIFTHEFTAVEREEKKPGELAGKVKRDANGEAIVKPCDPPLWVEEVEASQEKKPARSTPAPTE